MATTTPRGQRGITLIEIILWCAIVAAAVVAVFVFGKKASVTAAVETEQRQIEDVVQTVNSLFALQPDFSALGTNGIVGAKYLKDHAPRSGLKFSEDSAGRPALMTSLGDGQAQLRLVKSNLNPTTLQPDATQPANTMVLQYMNITSEECVRLIGAAMPIATRAVVGHYTGDPDSPTSALVAGLRGSLTAHKDVIASKCAAPAGQRSLVHLYFMPARATASAAAPAPPPAARCNPVHEKQNVACPAGQVGTVTQERDGACTGAGNTMVYTVWTTTNDTCQAAPTPPATVTPPSTPDDCTIITATRVQACPIGQIGQIVQSSQQDTCAGTSTPWVTTSNSCQPQPPSATCSPSTQQQTLACPAGQGGQVVQTRSSTCATSTSAPSWSPWATVSNTCTTSCTQGGSSCCTVKRETQPGAACAAGTYGTAGEQERFLGCANAMTQSASWTPWQDFTGGSCTACPATNTETNTRWVARSVKCADGVTDARTYEAEQAQTRSVSYSCPAGTTALPPPNYSAWSGWTDTGAERNSVTNVCPALSACDVPEPERAFNWSNVSTVALPNEACPAPGATFSTGSAASMCRQTSDLGASVVYTAWSEYWESFDMGMTEECSYSYGSTSTYSCKEYCTHLISLTAGAPSNAGKSITSSDVDFRELPLRGGCNDIYMNCYNGVDITGGYMYTRTWNTHQAWWSGAYGDSWKEGGANYNFDPGKTGPGEIWPVGQFASTSGAGGYGNAGGVNYCINSWYQRNYPIHNPDPPYASTSFEIMNGGASTTVNLSCTGAAGTSSCYQRKTVIVGGESYDVTLRTSHNNGPPGPDPNKVVPSDQTDIQLTCIDIN